MRIDEEKLFAWLDGELAPEESAQVEAAVAADPELARIAAEHRALAARLCSAFDAVAAAPVPAALAGALQRDGKVVDLSSRRRRLFPRVISAPVPQWAAMAATLALGIALGSTVNLSGAGAPVEVRGGDLYAGGAVADALETQLASAQTDAAVRVGLTYRTAEGKICRSFQSSAAAGLACRSDGRWALRGLFPSRAQPTDFRMAAGVDPALAELIDSTISGEPFDAAQERAAKKRGWR